MFFEGFHVQNKITKGARKAAELTSLRFLRERIRLTRRAITDAKKEAESKETNIRSTFSEEDAKTLREQKSKETVVLRRWESIVGNLVLTTELKT